MTNHIQPEEPGEREVELFEDHPGTPGPKELTPAAGAWAKALGNMMGAFQQDRDQGLMTGEERDRFNAVARPQIIRVATGAGLKAFMYSDPGHIMPEVLGACHAVQMITNGMEKILRRSEDSQAAYLQLERAAGELIKSYEAIAWRMATPVPTQMTAKAASEENGEWNKNEETE